MLSVTKEFRFEAAHSISNHEGMCRNIHGHSYVLEVSVSGNRSSKSNMVIDFKDLRRVIEQQVIKEYDHALLLKRNDVNLVMMKNSLTRIVWFEEEPTAESMLLDVVRRIQPVLPEQVKLSRLKLRETETSFAEWMPDAEGG